MIKYWKIKTSANTHMKHFIEIIHSGHGVGEKIEINYDEKFPKIFVNNKKINIALGQSAVKQMIVGWEALGLIIENRGEKIIVNNFTNQEDISNYSKSFLLLSSNKNKVNEYRMSKLVNCLICGKIYTFSDLKKIGISQKRGNISLKKINEEIAKYERTISNDKWFLLKAKEAVDDK